MGRMGEKINVRYNSVMTESELLNAKDEVTALEEKYKGDLGPSVDAELDALLAELNIGQEEK